MRVEITVRRLLVVQGGNVRMAKAVLNLRLTNGETVVIDFEGKIGNLERPSYYMRIVTIPATIAVSWHETDGIFEYGLRVVK